MNVNKTILGLKNKTGIDVEQDMYTGTNDKYITFNYADETVTIYADGEPQADIAYMQIHLFTPIKINYFRYKEQISKYLLENDFSITSVMTFLEKDTKFRHTVIEANITEEREVQ